MSTDYEALASAAADRLREISELLADAGVSGGTIFAGVRELRERAERAELERAELQATFDLRWQADMRAIKRWQAAGSGLDLTWPDHSDLVVWLLDLLPAQPPPSVAPREPSAMCPESADRTHIWLRRRDGVVYCFLCAVQQSPVAPPVSEPKEPQP